MTFADHQRSPLPRWSPSEKIRSAPKEKEKRSSKLIRLVAICVGLLASILIGLYSYRRYFSPSGAKESASVETQEDLVSCDVSDLSKRENQVVPEVEDESKKRRDVSFESFFEPSIKKAMEPERAALAARPIITHSSSPMQLSNKEEFEDFIGKFAEYKRKEVYELCMGKKASDQAVILDWYADYEPVHIAANYGQVQLCKYLLTERPFIYIKNVDKVKERIFFNKIDTINGDGWTPLIFAIYGGHLDCVRFFIECKANVNHRTRYWGCPLFYAVVRAYKNLEAYKEIVKMLLDAGANVDVKVTSSEEGLVAYAKKKKVPEEIISLLLEHSPS